MCAVIKQGILGGFSGSVANVVGSSWKGVAVMKAKPLSVANPRTAAQIAQRNKFAAAVAALTSVLGSVVKPVNDRFSGQMSGFNYCLQDSLAAFDESGNLVDHAELKFSRSKKGLQLVDAIAADAKLNRAKVQWTSVAGVGQQLGTDKMYCVGYNPATGEFVSQVEVVSRSSEEILLDFSDDIDHQSIIVWLTSVRSDGTISFAQSVFTEG